MTPQSSNPITFTIIVNNYNYGRFLDGAIQSALNQTHPDVEVVVVDDGSTDESREIVAGYGDKVVTVLKENGGQGSAFNAGFVASRGEWILFLDSDDLFAPNKVESLVSYVQRFPSAGIIAHNLKYSDEETKPLTPSASAIGALRLVDERRLVRQGRLTSFLPATSALAVKRSILSMILPMPEDIAITADNYVKFAALSLAPALLIPDQLAIQRIHGGNAYTRFTHTDDSRLEQYHISAKIAFHLKERFPHLSKLVWKQYGRMLFQLSNSGSPDTKRIREKIHSEYSPFEYSPLCCFYVWGAFVKSLVRDRFKTQ
jgi:glycosyltransferase involved in cell wall biosynthesis